jgi:fibronectin-binding autotransporter adhesin
MHTKTITALLIALTAAVLAVLGPAATARSATTCTKTWKSAVDGDWADPAKWSPSGAPTTADDVCITAAGSYTIRVADSRSVHSLTIGGTSGTQTLRLDATQFYAALYSATSVDVGANGAIALTSSLATDDYLDTPQLTNAGTLSVEAGSGGARYLRGSLTNTGTVTIAAATAYDRSGTFLNQGTLGLANAPLALSNGGGLDNEGAIAATGAGQLTLANGAYKHAGTFSGPDPIVVAGGSLELAGSNPAAFVLRGNVTLVGNVAAGQTIYVDPSASPAYVTALAAISNAGTIRLDSGAQSATLDLRGGLANSGTLAIAAEPGATRHVQGSVANSGTVDVEADTSYSGPTGATFTNQGSLKLVDAALTVSYSPFTNAAGGSIAETGSGRLVLTGTLDWAGGALSGPNPISLTDSTLDISGTGPAAFVLRGTSSLGGTVASGQTLTLDPSSTIATLRGSSFRNEGTVAIGPGTNIAQLYTTDSAGFVNAGTLSIDGGGTRRLAGFVTNTGTVHVAAATSYDAFGATFLNQGALELADATLTVVGSTLSNAAGGSIAETGTGQLMVTGNGSTFGHGAGTITGANPVRFGAGAMLDVSGSNPGAFVLNGNGYLRGGLPGSQQMVTVEGTCAGSSSLAGVSGGFTSNGTIVLTSSGCAQSAEVYVPTQTLANAGTLRIEKGAGGARWIRGSLANAKLVELPASTTLQVAERYSQTKKGQLKTWVRNATAVGKLAVSASGSASLAGTLAIARAKAFVPAVGDTIEILTGGTLSGAFSKETGAVIAQARYFLPSYAASSVSLLVKEASASITPASGQGGTTVAVTGSSLPPSDTVTLTFTDAHGTITTLGTVTTDSAGAFTTSVAIPASAAAGNGNLGAKSKLAAVQVLQTFTVT